MSYYVSLYSEGVRVWCAHVQYKGVFPFLEGHRHLLTEHASQLLLIKNSLFMFKVYNTKNNFPSFGGVEWAPRKGQGPPRTFHKLAQMDLHNPPSRYNSAHPLQESLPVHWGQDVVRCYVIWGVVAGRHLSLPSAGSVRLTGGILSAGSSGWGELECLGGFCLDAPGRLGYLHTPALF